MRHVVAVLLLPVMLLGSTSLSFAQEQAPAATSAQGTVAANGNGDPPGIDPDALPVDIERIQRRLARPPAIRPESARLVFRTEVFGRKPTIDEILGPDWRLGPTPLGAMTHREFLDIVTPKDVQGYAAFDNKQGMVVAATSFALQWALQQAITKWNDAKTARQKQQAQKEVDEALAELREARRKAGLPDR